MLDFKRFFENKPNTEQSQSVPIEFYEVLFRHYPQPIFVLNLDGDVVLFNDAFVELFGFRPTNMKQIIKRMIPKNDLRSVRDSYRRALQGNYQTFPLKTTTHLYIKNLLIPVHDQTDVIGTITVVQNQTALEQGQQHIHHLEMILQGVQSVASIGIWDYDIEEDLAHGTDQLYDILGLDQRFSLSMKDFLQSIHPDDRKHVQQKFHEALKERQPWSIHFRVIWPDGTERFLKQYCFWMMDDQEKPRRCIGTIHDVTDLSLLQSYQHFDHLQHHLYACLLSYNMTTNQCITCSPNIEQMTGFSAEDFLNGTIRWEELIHPDDEETYRQKFTALLTGEGANIQYRIIDKHEQTKWIQDRSIPTFDEAGRLGKIEVLTLDITEQKEFFDRVAQMAHRDHLTNLPNRQMLDDEMNKLISKPEDPFALMHVDLDAFKRINDTLGHEIGDKLLAEIASRLSATLSEHDLLARLAGDEFSILLRHIAGIDQVITKAQTILQIMNQPYKVDDLEIYISASIGIVLFPEDGRDVLTLSKKADAALDRAKRSGKNHYKIYSSIMNIESFKQYELERDLRKAIQEEQFILHYQPKIDVHSQKIVGAEALIRWEHPVWGLISPKEFIGLSEENGFISHITDWSFREVCRQLKKWEQQGIPLLPISINFSPNRMLRADWADTFVDIMEETNVDPSLIEIEITETILIDQQESFLANIDKLKNLGVKIALDDFGTGYSSLVYLHQYQIDTIKIDRTFIEDYTDEKGAPIIKALIGLAHELNVNIVAEGVETKEQFDFLKKHDCNQVQGYLFSKPLPVDEFEEVLGQQMFKLNRQPQSEHKIENRELFRFDLPYPLSAHMTIAEIKGQPVKLGYTEVLAMDIGIGGLCFISYLKLPVQSDMILLFETELLEKNVNFRGKIVWQSPYERGYYQYGIQFELDEDDEAAMTALVNKLAIMLRKKPLLTGCRFITDNPLHYLEAVRQKS